MTQAIKKNRTTPRPTTEEESLMHVNGLVALLIFFIILAFCGSNLLSLFSSRRGEFGSGSILNFITPVVIIWLMSGFKILQPNTALVATFFGKYSGTLADSGFFWIIPLYSTERVSLKTNTHITPIMKVNDGNGNPIEIAAAVVWHISKPASAVYDVEHVAGFIQTQCESALRALASNHPYENDQPGKPSLRLHAEDIIEELLGIVQDRLEQAGVQVDEARFTHLAYAPEIAQAMLRRQQAQSIVAARATIVEGAVSMVESAVRELEERKVVMLDQKDRARLVTNMLTVLLSEEGARPVVSIGASEH